MKGLQLEGKSAEGVGIRLNPSECQYLINDVGIQFVTITGVDILNNQF